MAVKTQDKTKKKQLLIWVLEKESKCPVCGPISCELIDNTRSIYFLLSANAINLNPTKLLF